MCIFLSQRDCRPFVPALPAGKQTETLFCTLSPLHPHLHLPAPPAGDSYVSLPSSSGNVRVTVQDWTDLVVAAAPDVVCMLSDEISSVSTGGSSRSRKSIDRSCQWLSQQLADLRSHPSLKHTAVFAAVQGGSSAGNRARACSSISALKVDGVVIGGLNTGEEREERCDIIRAVLHALPPHLPRMLSSTAGPEDMLDAGERRLYPKFDTLNLFNNARRRSCTRRRLHGLQLQQRAGGGGISRRVSRQLLAVPALLSRHAMRGHQGVSIHHRFCLLNDAAAKDPSLALDCAPLLQVRLSSCAQQHRLSVSLFVQGCSCAACSRHSRSYLHHLWNTHEMLAEVIARRAHNPKPLTSHNPAHLTPFPPQVLLAVHNLHHCRLLLQHARAAVSAGNFNE